MITREESLSAHRRRLAEALNRRDDALRSIIDDIMTRYDAPARHYHNLAHIHAVLDIVEKLAGSTAGASLLVAAWFHDAVYDAQATDNEEKSAALARQSLGQIGIANEILKDAERLILLTVNHQCETGDVDGAILLDADLAILGAGDATYDAYAAAIRREYAWVADADYRKGRTAVLERLLARPQIFRTALLVASCEDRARRNLRREIAGLAHEEISSSG